MYLGCHGIPDRCFAYRGKLIPFCARCLGASLGHIVAFGLFLNGSLPGIFIAIVLMLIMGIDWSLQKWFGIISTNLRRLTTGISGGLGVGVIIWTGIKETYLFLINVLYAS